MEAKARNNRRAVFSMVSDALVATQLWAVNQHAAVEEAVFSVGVAPRLYSEDITQLELELGESPELTFAAENWVSLQSWQLVE